MWSQELYRLQHWWYDWLDVICIYHRYLWTGLPPHPQRKFRGGGEVTNVLSTSTCDSWHIVQILRPIFFNFQQFKSCFTILNLPASKPFMYQNQQFYIWLPNTFHVQVYTVFLDDIFYEKSRKCPSFAEISLNIDYLHACKVLFV